MNDKKEIFYSILIFVAFVFFVTNCTRHEKFREIEETKRVRMKSK